LAPIADGRVTESATRNRHACSAGSAGESGAEFRAVGEGVWRAGGGSAVGGAGEEVAGVVRVP
jgi:hypothetical protein